MTVMIVTSLLTAPPPEEQTEGIIWNWRYARLPESVQARYTGFQIPNDYVVGYGLGYRELYRNLPFICVLRQSAYIDLPTPALTVVEPLPDPA